jgi:hypothetical protein
MMLAIGLGENIHNISVLGDKAVSADHFVLTHLFLVRSASFGTNPHLTEFAVTNQSG